jgi:formimidoylglutamate deiminase
MMTFWAEMAWIDGQWQHKVRLAADESGFWQSIQTNVDPEPQDEKLGVVLPGLVDAHSHAFQRAMVGFSEQGSADGDNFWRWRDAMYQVALRITPEQLSVIAAWLYAELLSQGYTQVCEFHYVHRDPDGEHYANPAQMALAAVDAAKQTGIGITVLPTLYQHRGFGQRGLGHDQRRFASRPELICSIRDSVKQSATNDKMDHLVNAGVAIHSLRAVHEPGLHELLAGCGEHPIHIHVSEQQREVQDCVAHTGRRPIEWLADRFALDARWNLVHATHAVPAELQAIARQGASVVICPVTEANLGDGIFDLETALDAGLSCSIGTDSHTNRDWAGELRSLEYSLRLTRLARNVASCESSGFRPTGQVLFDMALSGGVEAAGLPLAGLAVGQRADVMEIDRSAIAVAGVPDENLMEALVFSTPAIKPQQVFVAGKRQAPDLEAITAKAAQVMRELWQP